MFEKEAEEYAGQSCFTEMSNPSLSESIDISDYIKEAVMFGYNKANEWHYVKDGDYPKDDKQYLVLFSYNYKGKQEMSCGVRDNLHSDFEINRCYTEQIIAWKEIVLPELKESE